MTSSRSGFSLASCFSVSRFLFPCLQNRCSEVVTSNQSYVPSESFRLGDTMRIHYKRMSVMQTSLLASWLRPLTCEFEHDASSLATKTRQSITPTPRKHIPSWRSTRTEIRRTTLCVCVFAGEDACGGGPGAYRLQRSYGGAGQALARPPGPAGLRAPAGAPPAQQHSVLAGLAH